MGDNQLLQDLETLIKGSGVDNAFSADAAKTYHKAMDMVKDLQQANVELRESVDKLDAQVSRERGEIRNLTEHLRESKEVLLEWEGRDNSLIQRENRIEILELTAMHESQRVHDHQEMFGLVFRNTALRETVLTHNTTEYNTNGYGEQGNHVTKGGTDTETRKVDTTKTEE